MADENKYISQPIADVNPEQWRMMSEGFIDFRQSVDTTHDDRSDKDYDKLTDKHWSRKAFHFYTREIKEKVSDAYQRVKTNKRSFFKSESSSNYGGAFGPNMRNGRSQRHWLSYVDTSLGGNFPMNTAYRFTHTSDINIKRLYDGYGNGMGRWYATKIEDNAHDIHLRFGLQKFNNPFTWFSNWFDYYSYSLSTHGRAPSIFYELGQLAGLVAGFIFRGVLIIGWLTKLFGLLGGSRFWYVQPTMPLYWTTVNTLFNKITSSMSLTMGGTEVDAVSIINGGANPSADLRFLKDVTGILPEVYHFDNEGFAAAGFHIDVRRVVNRTQALENQLNQSLMKKVSKIDGEAIRSIDQFSTWEEELSKVTDGNQWLKNNKYKLKTESGIEQSVSTRAMLYEYLTSRAGVDETKEKHVMEKMTKEEASAKNTQLTNTYGGSDNQLDNLFNTGTKQINQENIMNMTGESDSFFDLLMKQLNDGSDWVTFRVNGTKSESESFSNRSEESALAGIINGWAATKRQLSFNFAGGEAFGSILSSIGGAITDFVAGAASSIQFDGLIGFLLGGKIDIPKTYSDSSASVASSMSYTIKLRTPYGHPLAIAQDLYLPMCCAIAGALPLSQGRSAYGAPFYCELYDKGRAVVKNGLISSLNIERATSGVAWTRDGLPLGIDITFTIENLDTAVHLPLTNTSIINGSTLIMGHEGNLADYISSLTALSLPDMIYASNFLTRNKYNFIQQWHSFWDKDHFAQVIAERAPMSFMKVFMSGTDRR